MPAAILESEPLPVDCQQFMGSVTFHDARNLRTFYSVLHNGDTEHDLLRMKYASACNAQPLEISMSDKDGNALMKAGTTQTGKDFWASVDVFDLTLKAGDGTRQLAPAIDTVPNSNPPAIQTNVTTDDTNLSKLVITRPTNGTTSLTGNVTIKVYAPGAVNGFGNAKLWYDPASTGIPAATTTLTAAPDTGLVLDITKIDTNAGKTIYLQGLVSSQSSNDVVIVAEFDPGAGYVLKKTMRDLVQVTVGSVHGTLGIDSDNNNGLVPTANGQNFVFEMPDESAKEQSLRTALPGKMVLVNDADTTATSVPDFAQGFAFTPAGAQTPIDNSGALRSRAFVPIIVRLPSDALANGSDNIKLKFVYSASDPKGIQVAPDTSPSGFSYTPAPGNWRIWLKDGIESRNADSVAQDGDFIPSNVEFSVSKLGMSSQNNKAVVYLEAVRQTPELPDNSHHIMLAGASTADVTVSAVTVGIQSQSVMAMEYVDFAPLTISGLAFENGGAKVAFFKAQFQQSKISWDGIQPHAYLLKSGVNDFEIDGNKGYKFGDDGKIRILGGLIADSIQNPNRTQDSFLKTSTGVLYSFSLPLFDGLLQKGQPLLGSFTVTERNITVGSDYTNYYKPPFGSASLLAIGGQVSIGSDGQASLTDNAKFTVSAFRPVDNFNEHKLGNPDAFRIDSVQSRQILGTGMQPGTTFLVVNAKIRLGQTLVDSDNPILEIPVEITPLAVSEPDPRYLDVARGNLSKRRALEGHPETDSQQDPTPLPDASNFAITSGGDTDSARHVNALSDWNIFMLGQIVDRHPNAGYWDDWLQIPTQVDGFSLTKPEIERVLSFGSSINMAALIENKGGPPNELLRRFGAVSVGNSDTAAKAAFTNTFSELKEKARKYISAAVLNHMKWLFSVSRDKGAINGLQTWAANQHEGDLFLTAPIQIQQPGYFDNVFGNPTKKLFQDNNLNWRVGHPSDEDIIDHMIAERYALVQDLLINLQKYAPGQPLAVSDAAWPLKAQIIQDAANFPEITGAAQFQSLPLLINLRPDSWFLALRQADYTAFQTAIDTGNYNVKPQVSGLYEFAQEIDPDNGNWTNGVLHWHYDFINKPFGLIGQSGNTGIFSITFEGATGGGSSQLNQYGHLIKTTLDEIFALKTMLANRQQAVFYTDFRTRSPISFYFFIIGDFIFSLQDIYTAIKGEDLLTGVQVSLGQRVFASAMSVLSVTGGVGFIEAGQGIVKRFTLRAEQKVAAAQADIATNAMRKLTTPNAEMNTVLSLAEKEGANAGASPLSKDAGAYAQFRGSTQALPRMGLNGAKSMMVNAGGKIDFTMTEVLANDSLVGSLLDAQSGRGPLAEHVEALEGSLEPERFGKSLNSIADRPQRISQALELPQTVVPQNGTSYVDTLLEGSARNPGEFGAVEKQLVEQALAIGGEAKARNMIQTLEYLQRTMCFPAGTKIMMGDGTLRPIERVVVGDAVMSRDQFNPNAQPQVKYVSHLTRLKSVELRRLTLRRAGNVRTPSRRNVVKTEGLAGGDDADGSGDGDGDDSSETVTLSATPDHPFWVTNGGWTPAGNVKVGARLVGFGSEEWECRSNDRLADGTETPVFNFTVEGFHSYFVAFNTANGRSVGVWAHNGYCDEGERVAAALIQFPTLGDEKQQALEALWKAERDRALEGSMGNVPARNDDILAKNLQATPGRSIPLGARKQYQPNHLINIQSIEENLDLFRDGITSKTSGRTLPGIGIETNGVENGQWLPSNDLLSEAEGWSRHRGAHNGYNQAIDEMLGRIKGKIVQKLDSGVSLGTIHKYATQKVADLQSAARKLLTQRYVGSKLPTQFSGRVLPLQVGSAPDLVQGQDEIRDLWITALQEIFTP